MSADSGGAAKDPRDGGVAIEADEAAVLHLLRVKGFLTTDGFVHSLGVYPGPVIAGLVDEALIRHAVDSDMHSLEPAGRERHEELLPTFAGATVRSALHEPYQAFLQLNAGVKELCTRWQLRDGQPNDHADADYDRACTSDLVELNRRADEVLASMAEVLPRLSRYRSRLGEAVNAVSDGAIRRFTGVLCESFHDIWMELHEDLIVLQGIDRAQEGSA